MCSSDQQRASEDAWKNAWTRTWLSIRVQESIEHYRNEGAVPQNLKEKINTAIKFVEHLQSMSRLSILMRAGKYQPGGNYGSLNLNIEDQCILDHDERWNVKKPEDIDALFREFSTDLAGLAAGTPGLKLDRTHDFFCALCERYRERINREIDLMHYDV